MFFFFNDTATTEISTLSLHDALPISITVTPVNDAPVANNDSATVAEGGTATGRDSTAASVLANDTDAEGNPLTATKLSDPAHGSVTLNADGTFSYSHDGSETTTDSFTYKTCDNGTTGSPPVADPKCSGTAKIGRASCRERV